MKVSGQSKLLMFLLGLLAVSLSLNFTPRTDSASGISIPPPPPRSRMDSFPDPRLETELLDQARTGDYAGIRRNVFDFDSSVPFVQSFSRDDGSMPPGTLMEDSSLPDLRYIGLYQEKREGGERMAAISNGGRVFLVHAGEMIENRYKLLTIEDDFIVAQNLSDGRVFRFPLGKYLPPEEVEEGQ